MIIPQRKNKITCHSEIEMDAKAEALLEKGYQAERKIGVQSIPNLCILTYQVLYWK
ncbi:MAG: hypothetical protein KBT48_03380 [Firmicutes bacterium]|nr:hypothetical protein [Bacillota bacterium]